jgi:hypothetical protein
MTRILKSIDLIKHLKIIPGNEILSEGSLQFKKIELKGS